MTDDQITQELLDARRITEPQLNAWMLSQDGYTLYRIREFRLDDTQPYRRFAASTIHQWIHHVTLCIDEFRYLEKNGRLREGRTLDEHDDPRFATDVTALHIVPTDQSNWDCDKLKLTGAKARW